ncbi:hypothetical protein HRbin36_02103 [bacterium HR36]|uniref:Hypothetical conserved protein n=1 Tax=uncultured Planctomycetota bacterium TaxID=120965 RepID=H5SCZ0_9BACT|nr:hypothetical conserved protein [uncultured Planctomycetota bacterium]GBD36973.1 hypothetical protein HRbin36_02103 [bacterium HR36]
MVGSATATLATLESLREYVLRSLCEQDALDPHQVQFLEHVLRRGPGIAGLMWEVRGPRRLRTQAIWAYSERRIYFYNSAGQRVGVVHLTAWPNLAEQAA